MLSKRHNYIFLFVFLWSIFIDFPVYPEIVSAETNAEIINKNVNLRDQYPKFSLKTLFKFRFDYGAILGVVEAGTRVNVIRRKIVVKKYEWFEIQYTTENGEKRGWIYGGPVNNRLYIRLDDGVEESIPVAKLIDRGMSKNLLSLATLYFEVASAEGAVTANEPEIRTNPFKTLLLSLCYIIIFIASQVIIKKWVFPQSNFYSFLSSLSILLILGFISDNQFSEIIGSFVAKIGQ